MIIFNANADILQFAQQILHSGCIPLHNERGWIKQSRCVCNNNKEEGECAQYEDL